MRQVNTLESYIPDASSKGLISMTFVQLESVSSTAGALLNTLKLAMAIFIKYHSSHLPLARALIPTRS